MAPILDSAEQREMDRDMKRDRQKYGDGGERHRRLSGGLRRSKGVGKQGPTVS